QYNVSKGKIGSANPGVLSYYTGLSNTIKGVEGSVVDGKPDPITVFIDQNDNSPLVGPFTATNADVKLFKVNDLNHDGIIDSGDTSTQVQLKANQIQTNAGDVTVNFTPDAIGSLYVISVQYTTNAVVGTNVGTVPPTVNYTFSTDVGKDGTVEETAV